MSITEITSLETLERYIMTKNHVLDCFEDGIIQYLANILEEKQIFFIIKNPSLNNLNLEGLKKRYFQYIDGNYSPHQLERVGYAPNGNVIALRTWDLGEHAKNENEIFYEPKKGLLSEVFHKEEISHLYEDGSIMIFTITTKIYSIHEDEKIRLKQPGYQINPEKSNEIIPYQDGPYVYHYYRIPHFILEEKKGKSYVNLRMNQMKETLKIIKANIEEEKNKRKENDLPCKRILAATEKVS